MKRFLFLFVSMISLVAQEGSAPVEPGEKPESLFVGVWHKRSGIGDEFLTAKEDGTFILQSGHKIMKCRYRFLGDKSPWPMEWEVLEGDVPDGRLITIYTIADFPVKNEFRFGRTTGLKEHQPTVMEPENSQTMKRVVLEGNQGIFQVVEAHNKALHGKWKGTGSDGAVELSFDREGKFQLTMEGLKDKGQFRVDVRKSPSCMTMLSSEGRGIGYMLYDMKPGKTLHLGRGVRSPEDLPESIDEPGGIQLERVE